MKTFTYVILFTLMLFTGVISGQTCNGNTFNSPGAPATCTYSYTASGWEDQFGNPISTPASVSTSQSVCILVDNADAIGGSTFEGTFYVPAGISFTGSLPNIRSGATLIAEGTISLSNSPVFNGSTIYVDATGSFTYPGDFSPQGICLIENAGTIDINGTFGTSGNTTTYNHENAFFYVQGDTNLSSEFYNCGLLEVFGTELKAGGGSDLFNFCTVYAHNDYSLNADYFNEGLLMIDGEMKFNSNVMTNNGTLLINNITINNESLIGNNDTSVLIVKNNSELINGAIITGHYYFDVDDGGGFDTVCGTCTEDINILPDVDIPSAPDDIKADCGNNIIYYLCTETTGTDSDGDGVYDLCDLDDDNDGIPDTVELGTVISTEQQPCGGDTSLDFSGTQTLLSGTDLQQGAVYRFSNITGSMDAIVTIVETNNATVAELDRNVTTPESFKPRTGFNFTNAGEFGYIEYLIQFVNTGGFAPQTIDKFFMNFNDLDGGPNFGEQNWADNPKTYTIDDPTEVTMNTDGTWIVATGATSDYGPSTNEFPYINFAVNYTNKSEIRIRVGAVARVAGVSSSGRSHSIEFNCVTNYVAPKTYSLDGDFDGLPNHLDLDSDNDAILDAVEAGHGQTHTNGILSGSYGTNGLPDIVETTPGSGTINYSLTDTDGTEGSNFLDADSDDDGCLDALEGTGVYDYSDININSGQLSASIDVNGVPGGTSQGTGTSADASMQATICNSGATIDFDGIDDYVEVVNSVIDGLNEYTLSFWFKYDGPAITNSDEIFVMGQKDLFEITIRNWGSGQPQYEAIQAGVFQTSSLKQSTGRYFVPGDWSHLTVTVSHSGGNTDYRIFSNGWGSSIRNVSSTINTNSNPFRIGIANGSTSYGKFEGAIDELKIFNKVLTDEQIQQMVYQEIKNEGGNVRGTIIDKDIKDKSTSTLIPWTDLITYYPMTNIKSNEVPDASAYGNAALLYNITTIQPQSAPLPYETVSDGDWTDEATWLHGNIWDIETMIGFFGSSNQSPEPWSIVQLHHNVTTSLSHRSLGLFIDANKTFTVDGDNEINNSWYVQLDGTLDLKDDSQLIQTGTSDLVTSAAGKILRRQEGNANKYWYNYWASPVGAINATSLIDNNGATNNPNNTPYSLKSLKNGVGTIMQFTNAFDEVGKVSRRWLYTYQNGVSYWDWNNFDENSAITPGIGYIQKGTGNAGLEQQYTFEGKPNNGTIILNGVDTGGPGSVEDVSLTTYLLGNPYPSALDARTFITDNAGTIGGTILLWEQWAGDTHLLAEYEGGYGYINAMATSRAYQDPSIPIANQTQTQGIKTPTFFIPVGQGFLVEVENDGDIEFNNDQRVFKQESLGESVFYRNEGLADNSKSTRTEDYVSEEFELIRLEFATSEGASRHFVIGFGQNATDEFDYGLDGGKLTSPVDDDMASILNGEPYVLQAFSPITPDKEIDLFLNSSGELNYFLDIVELVNIDENQDIYVRDNRQNVYWNLTDDGAYHFSALEGEDTERFDIVFQTSQTLSVAEEALNNVVIFANNDQEKLFVKGIKEQVKSLTLNNILGQTVRTFLNPESQSLENGLQIGNLSSGVYMVNLRTESNLKLDKKIILE